MRLLWCSFPVINMKWRNSLLSAKIPHKTNKQRWRSTLGPSSVKSTWHTTTATCLWSHNTSGIIFNHCACLKLYEPSWHNSNFLKPVKFRYGWLNVAIVIKSIPLTNAFSVWRRWGYPWCWILADCCNYSRHNQTLLLLRVLHHRSHSISHFHLPPNPLPPSTGSVE